MFSKFVKGFLLVFVLLIIFNGCSGNKSAELPSEGRIQPDNTESNITIVTSFYPIYLHTINIANNIPGVKVVNMTEARTGCLHDYSITTTDMKMLEEAKIFVINGAGMEAFMDKVIKQMPDLRIVDASMKLELIKDEVDQENKEQEAAGKGNESANPHLWVSTSGAIGQVKNIGEQLAVLDPTHAQQYRDNTRAYVEKLETLKDKMHQELDHLKNRNIVTFHEAFPYFAREFNLNIVSVIEREPGTEPSAQELADTIQTIKTSKVKALFAEPQYSGKAADTIARETGLKVYLLDPVVTGEANGDVDAYIRTMEKNLTVLQEALK